VVAAKDGIDLVSTGNVGVVADGFKLDARTANRARAPGWARVQGTAPAALMRGADPNYVGGIDGMSVLGMAARMGHTDVVQLLLDRGTNPATLDLSCSTALDRVLRENNREPSEQRAEAIRILQAALTPQR